MVFSAHCSNYFSIIQSNLAMTKKLLMLIISASSSLVYFLVGFSSASPLSSPLELILLSSLMGSMLLSQMDVSKVLVSKLSCTWYSWWLLFISNAFCPCFHDTTSPDFVPVSLSLVLTISSSYWTLLLNAWKYQEPLLDSLLILPLFIYGMTCTSMTSLIIWELYF